MIDTSVVKAGKGTREVRIGDLIEIESTGISRFLGRKGTKHIVHRIQAEKFEASGKAKIGKTVEGGKNRVRKD